MERLYNNITLPDAWPPRMEETTLDKPLPVPYLEKKPEYIDISVGRQLFVDDFLIADTDLKREYGQPETCGQPVLYPETELELNDGYCTCACPFNGGVFFDQKDRKYKMWYHAGWFDGSAYAESRDGVRWQRIPREGRGQGRPAAEWIPAPGAGPDADAGQAPEGSLRPGPDTDRILDRIPGYMRDGDMVWLDEQAENPEERYRMLVFYRCFDKDYRYYHQKPRHAHDDPTTVAPREVAVFYRSGDGIHWEQMGEIPAMGDNTTFFYNPFRKKWVFSLRTFSKLDSRVRVRGYCEREHFFEEGGWKEEDVRFWARTDIFDKPDPELGYYTQIYNLDAVAYESIMLGVYSVFMGPPNFVCGRTGMPKINDLKLGFSRDGFHFSRGEYGDFLTSSRTPGTWDYGYLHPAGGICTVQEDELYFYYSAFSGESPQFGHHKYSGGGVGLAKLRRDGFACMYDEGGAGGSLTTEVLAYSGEYFFVNADCRGGSLRAELLDEAGEVIPAYSREKCRAVCQDGTKQQIVWDGAPVLKDIPGKIRVRFLLNHARLYAFWITDDAGGRSHGYLGAGSPVAGEDGRG